MMTKGDGTERYAMMCNAVLLCEAEVQTVELVTTMGLYCQVAMKQRREEEVRGGQKEGCSRGYIRNEQCYGIESGISCKGSEWVVPGIGEKNR